MFINVLQLLQEVLEAEVMVSYLKFNYIIVNNLLTIFVFKHMSIIVMVMLYEVQL